MADPRPPPHPDLAYYLAFTRVKGIGSARVRKLEARFVSLREAWHADGIDLTAAGLDERSVYAILSARKSIDPDAEIVRLSKAGAAALTWHDPAYPRLLREVADPPPVLFLKGELADADCCAVAIVGTRGATVYGRQVAERLAGELAQARITVVSGLARGIDAVAHQAALDAGGRTLAVLGCGADVIYPPEHRKLAAAISERGALLSDYPLGTGPEKNNFPPRNRIISGLSLGVVVVEADEKSGALITALFATDQGREVFAVPGNVFSAGSRGANRLIQQGAKMVLQTSDILEELNLGMVLPNTEAQLPLPMDDAESRIYKRLSFEPVAADELVRGLDMPAEIVSAKLSLMELKGYVRQAGGASYVRAR